MGLAEFILRDIDTILDEWARFAKNIPAASELDAVALRDHARGMLETIAADLMQPQSAKQQTDKSKGRAPISAGSSDADLHGYERMAAGFSVNDAMAEFRALRASVLRLWGAQQDGKDGKEHNNDMIRFNEAIDQALTESLARYSDVKDRQSRLFNALLSTSPDLNYLAEPDGTLLYVNKAFADLFGMPASSLLHENAFELYAGNAKDMHDHLRDAVAARSICRGEMAVDAGPERMVVYEYLLVPVFAPDGRCEAVAGTARDITERKAAEERTRRSANYDDLTGLPNRSLFHERLELDIKHATRTGLPLALLFIDLDGFKGVNDRLGHAAGDQLLAHVARRIGDCVRDTDTVARLSGDEFTVILTDITFPPYVETLAGNVLNTLRQPFPLRSTEVSISGSIGIAVFPQDGSSPEDLIRHADSAMYAAKNAGRDRYRFYRNRPEGRE